MAIACDAPSLSEAAKCYACLTPKQKESIKTYLLAVIAGGSTDPQVLMAEAKCFMCLTEKQLKAIQVYLTCQSANA
jgi:hypothetical protein